MKLNIKILFLFIIFKNFSCISEDLIIKTKALGAELISINYKGREYLHDGKKFWNQQSPILFPIVGKLRNGKTKINNKEFEIKRHGFANSMNFEEIGLNSYRLISNEKTLEHFPFNFELYFYYITEKNKLFFNYNVINKTPNETMLFGIGAHPGFKCDYYKEK